VECLRSGAEIKKSQKMRLGDRMLLKTNIEKMSLLRPDTMLMKTNELYGLCYDIYENKGTYTKIPNYVL